MSEYRFSSALGYTFEQLAEMHSLSFSGYFVDLTMTATQVADFWRFNQIDANRCVVMHVNGAFAGMARMGTRGTRGWCGGFGIAPEFRGTGASRQLAQEMVRVAQDSGLKQLQLEVLEQNERARKLYERVGFTISRRLIGLELETRNLPAAPPFSCETLPLETLFAWSRPASDAPYWGFEPASLLATYNTVQTLPGPDGRPNAFLAQENNGNARIIAALLQSQLRDDEFGALLYAVADGAQQVQVHNEPERSTLMERYRNLGFTETFRQYEMVLNF